MVLPACDSGGGDVPSCVGEVTRCGQVSNLESYCHALAGCFYVSPKCTGFPKSCYSMSTSYTCGSQPGCFWSSYNDDCSGSAWNCSMGYTHLTCTDIDGCSWGQSDCSGSAFECDTFDEEDRCNDQLGCNWE